MAAAIEERLDPELPAAERRKLSRAVIAAQIGTIAVARAVAKTDTALSDEVLESVRSMFGEVQTTRATSKPHRGGRSV